MYEYARNDNIKLSSIMYFLVIILIGNILLYNLFLSILMTNFKKIKDTSDEKKLTKYEKNKSSQFLKNCMFQLNSLMKKILFGNKSNLSEKIPEHIIKNNTNRRNAYFLNKFRIFATSDQNPLNQIKKALNSNYKPLVNNSLFFFKKNNSIRKFCWEIIVNKIWFEYTISFIIIISMVNLAIDSPNLQDRNVLIILFFYDVVISKIKLVFNNVFRN